MTGLGQLQELCLYDVNDEGLRYVGGIENLVRLTIDGDGLTDQGLRHLQRLPALEYLQARVTSISNDGFQEFRRQRPDVELRTDL